MNTYFFVILTIGLTVYGQIIIKSRAIVHAPSHQGPQFLIAMISDPWILSGLSAAFIASATWMMAVRDAKLSIIYPFMASTFVIVPILAAIIFGERINGIQLTGISFIIIGICLVAKVG